MHDPGLDPTRLIKLSATTTARCAELTF